ncbi:MAG: KpsF/GutQ family sugar-phosphate isomerase [Pseudomonadota bacterium]
MSDALAKSVSAPAPAVTSALRTLASQTAGMEALQSAFENGLSDAFSQAVSTIAEIKGRVIVTGVGKSGHIAAKIAATLASTGTPAYFVHASEANHGDLGMIARDDAVLALSWSGETAELGGVLSYSRRFNIPLIALTSGVKSTLGLEADIILALPKVKEACPHNLAPTSSTLLQLAMGDALAVALLEGRGFTAGDFNVFHPGGKLGAGFKQVRDVMHCGEEVPVIAEGSQMTEAIMQISEKGLGCVGVINGSGDLIGIITDGDLRRHLRADLLGECVDTIMTRDPKTISSDTLTASALEMLESSSITALFVTEGTRPVGVVHLHDLLRVGVA